MNLTVAPLTPEHHDAWDAVCEKSHEAWFWHSTRWLEYTLAYNPSLESQSMAFLLYDGCTAVAAVPIVIERQPHDGLFAREFSFGGGWLPSPVCVDGLSSKQKKQVFRVAFDRIFVLARQENVGRIRYRSNPFEHVKSGLESLIPVTVQFGFTSHILPTQIIDVRKSPVEILKGMRKGHRSDIRRAEKELEGFVMSDKNASDDLFASYQQLHVKAAGGQTRPSETFEMMCQWIRDGYGILVGASLKGTPVSFAYVNIFKDCAYYSSACNDPEIKDLPLAHFVQWEILNWLHEHAFHYYEIGWQVYDSTEVVPASDKEVAISRFKRGFGGFTVPMIVSERFLSREEYMSVSHERIVRFAETLPESIESSAQAIRGALR